MRDFESMCGEITTEIQDGLQEDPADILESGFEDDPPEWMQERIEREKRQSPSSTGHWASDGDGSLAEWDRFDRHQGIVETFYEALTDDDSVWIFRGYTGLYAMFAAKRVGATNVTAFEFDEQLSGELLRHLRWTGGEDVTLIPNGLSHEIEDVAGPGGETVRYYPAREIPEIRSTTAPTVVVLDANGAEWPALEGFSASQLDGIRELFVAVYEPEHPDAPTPDEWLESNGFEVTVIADDSGSSGRWKRFVRARNCRENSSLVERLRSLSPF